MQLITYKLGCNTCGNTRLFEAEDIYDVQKEIFWSGWYGHRQTHTCGDCAAKQTKQKWAESIKGRAIRLVTSK
jgi:hypothetical protein